MARHRMVRATRGKSSEQHSDTKVHVIGPGTVLVANHILRDTQVGARDPAGGDDTIQLGRGYGEECNVGDMCKYINIFIEAAGKSTADASQGWVEWAFVIKKTSDPNVTNANLGTNTLGDVCTKYFRNECIFTGVVPVGIAQPNAVAIQIKIPKTKAVLRTGDQWILYLYARTSRVTETGTDTFKVYSSCMYRNYH